MFSLLSSLTCLKFLCSYLVLILIVLFMVMEIALLNFSSSERREQMIMFFSFLFPDRLCISLEQQQHLLSIICDIYIYISGWIFQKVLAEIVQKDLILSQKALISNRRNLGLFAPTSMRFPSKDSKSKDLSFQLLQIFSSDFSLLAKRARTFVL